MLTDDLKPLKQTLIFITPSTFSTLVVCPMGISLNAAPINALSEFLSLKAGCTRSSEYTLVKYRVSCRG